jgi:hypothetical protein
MRKRRKKRLTVGQVDWLRVIESAAYVGDKGRSLRGRPRMVLGILIWGGHGGAAPTCQFLLLSQIGDKDRIAGLGAARADQLPSIA